MSYYVKRIILSILVIAFLGIVYDWTSSFSNDPVVLTEEARNLINGSEGDITAILDARQRLRKALSLDQNYVDAHVQLARSTYRMGYIGGAKYDPGSLTQAHEILDTALSIDPASIAANVIKGYVYLFQKDFAACERMVDRAAAIDETDPELRLLKASLYFRQQKYTEAKEQAGLVVTTTADQHLLKKALGNLASTALATRNWEAGTTTYQRLLTMAPNSPWTHINYCNFLFYKGDYDLAIKIGKRAVSLGYMGNAYRVLSKAYYGKGRQMYWEEHKYRESAEMFELAITNDPENADAHYCLGLALRVKARWFQSVDILHESGEAFEEALRINPDHEFARKELDSHNLHIGKFE